MYSSFKTCSSFTPRVRCNILIIFCTLSVVVGWCCTDLCNHMIRDFYFNSKERDDKQHFQCPALKSTNVNKKKARLPNDNLDPVICHGNDLIKPQMNHNLLNDFLRSSFNEAIKVEMSVSSK